MSTCGSRENDKMTGERKGRKQGGNRNTVKLGEQIEASSATQGSEGGWVLAVHTRFRFSVFVVHMLDERGSRAERKKWRKGSKANIQKHPKKRKVGRSKRDQAGGSETRRVQAR